MLILVIALIVFGPTKLPEIGRSMGRMLVEFRKASADFKRTIEDEVQAAESQKKPEPAALPAPPSAAPTPAPPPQGTVPAGTTPSEASPGEAGPSETTPAEKAGTSS